MDFHPKKMVKRIRGSPTVSLLILFIFESAHFRSFKSQLLLKRLYPPSLQSDSMNCLSFQHGKGAICFFFSFSLSSLFFFFWIKSEHNKCSFKYTVDFWTDINRCFPAYRMSVGSKQLKFQLLTAYSLFTMSTLTKPEQSIPYATLWFSYL